MSEFDQHPIETFAIIPAYDVQQAIEYADNIVPRPNTPASGIYHWYNEEYLRGGFSLLMRETVDEYRENFVGVKVLPAEAGKFTLTRYTLLSESSNEGIFMVSPPELYDSLEALHKSLSTDEEDTEIANRLMMDLGLYKPGENSWDEFMAFLEDGRSQKAKDEEYVEEQAAKLRTRTLHIPIGWYTEDTL